MSVFLINSSSDSLTVSWPEVSGALRYVLEYKKQDDDGDFMLLSDKLSQSQARKKNLEPTTSYQFRARAVKKEGDTEESWFTHQGTFETLSPSDSRLEAPEVHLSGKEALHVSWKASPGATGYELQLREATGGAPWTTIATSFAGTEVRKKNLTATHQFRVRPVGATAFSPPSEALSAKGVSVGLKSLFRTLESGQLLRKVGDPVALDEALEGKEFVLLYASASWCGPCRQFSPKLSQWYNSLGDNRSIEVIFLSADHDETSFQSYNGHMPWLAVDFEDDTRESLMAYLRVSGIPRLAVLDGRTGRIIEDNAVGKPLDINRWRQLAKATTK